MPTAQFYILCLYEVDMTPCFRYDCHRPIYLWQPLLRPSIWLVITGSAFNWNLGLCWSLIKHSLLPVDYIHISHSKQRCWLGTKSTFTHFVKCLCSTFFCKVWSAIYNMHLFCNQFLLSKTIILFHFCTHKVYTLFDSVQFIIYTLLVKGDWTILAFSWLLIWKY